MQLGEYAKDMLINGAMVILELILPFISEPFENISSTADLICVQDDSLLQELEFSPKYTLKAAKCRGLSTGPTNNGEFP